MSKGEQATLMITSDFARLVVCHVERAWKPVIPVPSIKPLQPLIITDYSHCGIVEHNGCRFLLCNIMRVRGFHVREGMKSRRLVVTMATVPWD